MTLEKRVKIALTVAGMTHTELAARMNVSRGYLREMLRGTRRLTERHRERLKELLCVGDELFQVKR